MEKIIIFDDRFGGASREESDINNHLEDGWKVKSITMSSTHDYVTAIVVLEK